MDKRDRNDYLALILIAIGGPLILQAGICSMHNLHFEGSVLFWNGLIIMLIAAILQAQNMTKKP